MKIISIIGARPQFIKVKALADQFKNKKGVRHIIIHTGQHYDHAMSRIFFDELKIPRADLNLGVGSGMHGWQTGRMMEKTEQALAKERPDWVLVYGDTNSTLAGALAAAKLRLPLAHIEAGLRSYNRTMPEEINRVLTDHAADLLFCPTKISVSNLRAEGISTRKIRLSGDIMYDVALNMAKAARGRKQILKNNGLAPKEYVLATIHRSENTEDLGRLRAIIEALSLVSTRIPVLIPLHPRTMKAVKKNRFPLKGIKCTGPVGYLDMAMLEMNARLIATDSGGVQKEAFFYRIPCVTLRDNTEWMELVQLGWNQVVPPDNAKVIAKTILDNLNRHGKNAEPYGRGNAARIIVGELLNA